MSEQKIRVKCACRFIDITKALEHMHSLASVRKKEPNWELLSLEADEIYPDDYKTCFAFNAGSRITKLKDAVKQKDAPKLILAIKGLQELKSLCDEVT